MQKSDLQVTETRGAMDLALALRERYLLPKTLEEPWLSQQPSRTFGLSVAKYLALRDSANLANSMIDKGFVITITNNNY